MTARQSAMLWGLLLGLLIAYLYRRYQSRRAMGPQQ